MLDQRPHDCVWELAAPSILFVSRLSLSQKSRLIQRGAWGLLVLLAISHPITAQSPQPLPSPAAAGESNTAVAPSAEDQSAEDQSAEDQTAEGQTAEGQTAPDAVVAFPNLTIAANATPAQLEALVRQAKQLRPRNADQYQAMQTAIRDASKKLVNQLDKAADAKRIQQAELDTIASSVALMAFVGEDSQQKTLEQVHEFLKGREVLSLQDTQTGVLAAAMLELQPNKQPARDTYQLLDDLLENDPREEMQSLRLNLQASVRRLDLLGHKFELTATSLDGRKIQIDDYAGKYVIVDFFASWCEPCLTDVPLLKEQLAKYQAKGLAVIAISLDTDAAALDKYLKQAELPWPVIHDNAEDPLQRLQMKFGVSNLPSVLLINKEGIVVSLEARGAELQRLLEMLFEAPTLAAPQTANPAAPANEQPAQPTASLIEPAK